MFEEGHFKNFTIKEYYCISMIKWRDACMHLNVLSDKSGSLTCLPCYAHHSWLQSLCTCDMGLKVSFPTPL